MVRDCPRLPQQAFTARNLDSMLEAASREFINKEKYVKLDDKKKRVYVSAIFKFYTKDFVASGKADDLIPYLNTYRLDKIPEDYTVKYMKYDWSINSQP